MGKDILLKKVAEQSNVVLRLRKAYKKPALNCHSVLTDDIFTYVDFFFKKHKKCLKDSNGNTIRQNYIFYWQQAHNFYKAAKILPVESSPLPMYYCMLNAAKAYILYYIKDFSDVSKDFGNHGIVEMSVIEDIRQQKLSEIFVVRHNYGVFPLFSKMLDDNFESKWPSGKECPYSAQELIRSLAFVHSAYISTYDIGRKDECFIPLSANETPLFYYCNDGKIHLIATLQKSYFSKSAVKIPEEIKNRIPNIFIVSPEDPFCIISKEGFKKSDIQNQYTDFRKQFSVISANIRLWYLNKTFSEFPSSQINDLSKIMALTHRFSEIVRYKPEQMEELLNGKENWLIHEFLSLALDQFIDELACEITKQEIMPTRYKLKEKN